MNGVEASIAVDTSIVVAGLILDHGQHELARPVLAAEPAIPAHVAFESYSVLTRLPMPGRLPPAVAAEVLMRAFGGRFVALTSEELETLLPLPGMGIVGGGVRRSGRGHCPAARAHSQEPRPSGRRHLRRC